jgi:hypothetical protein
MSRHWLPPCRVGGGERNDAIALIGTGDLDVRACVVGVEARQAGIGCPLDGGRATAISS